MLTSLPPPFFANIFDVTFPQFIGMLIPIVVIVSGCTVAIFGMYFSHRQRQSWHETARIALEKGQPVPPMPKDDGQKQHHDRDRGARELTQHDVRRGLVLIAVGAGLWLMLGGLPGAGNLRYIGAIPGFIGVALLLHALLIAMFGQKSQPPQNPPPRP